MTFAIGERVEDGSIARSRILYEASSLASCMPPTEQQAALLDIALLEGPASPAWDAVRGVANSHSIDGETGLLPDSEPSLDRHQVEAIFLGSLVDTGDLSGAIRHSRSMHDSGLPAVAYVRVANVPDSEVKKLAIAEVSTGQLSLKEYAMEAVERAREYERLPALISMAEADGPRSLLWYNALDALGDPNTAPQMAQRLFRSAVSRGLSDLAIQIAERLTDPVAAGTAAVVAMRAGRSNGRKIESFPDLLALQERVGLQVDLFDRAGKQEAAEELAEIFRALRAETDIYMGRQSVEQAWKFWKTALVWDAKPGAPGGEASLRTDMLVRLASQRGFGPPTNERAVNELLEHGFYHAVIDAVDQGRSTLPLSLRTIMLRRAGIHIGRHLQESEAANPDRSEGYAYNLALAAADGPDSSWWKNFDARAGTTAVDPFTRSRAIPLLCRANQIERAAQEATRVDRAIIAEDLLPLLRILTTDGQTDLALRLAHNVDDAFGQARALTTIARYLPQDQSTLTAKNFTNAVY